MTIIWFIVWMVHGHPYLLTEWNIALIACAFFDNIGTLHGSNAAGRRRGQRAG